MAIRVNVADLADFGRYDNLRASIRDGILTVRSPSITRLDTPYEVVPAASLSEDDYMTDPSLIGAIPWVSIKVATDAIVITDWGQSAIPIEPDPAPDALGLFSFPEMDKRLKHILKYASGDEGRPGICGVRFDAAPLDFIDLIATDGHRLIHDQVQDFGLCEGKISFTICAKALKKALKLAGPDGIGAIRIKAVRSTEKQVNRWDRVKEWDSTHSIVTFDGVPGWEFRGLVAEEYPDWQHVIPKDCTQRLDFTADRKALLMFAKETMKECGDRKCPLVKFVAVNGKISGWYNVGDDDNPRSVCSDPCGDATDPAAWITETLGFNARYLVDALNSFTGKTVRFQVKGTASACTIREGDRTVVLMPVRM